MQRFVAIAQFGDNLNDSLQEHSMQHSIGDHPEKDLIACMTSGEARRYLLRRR